MPTRRLALSAILLSLALLFCSILPSGSLGGSISDGERIATLDKISEMAQASTLPDGEMDRAALLQYFETNPQFELSGEADDGSVWARFNDGRLVIIPPPIPEASDAEAMLAPSPSSSPPAMAASSPVLAVAARPDDAQEGKAVSMVRQQSGKQFNLPASDNAIVMNTLGAGFTDASGDVNTWLNQKGYSSQPVPATVEKLKTVQNVGVFYMNTHGGAGCIGTFKACEAKQTPVAPAPAAAPATPTAVPPPGALTYALWTSSPVSRASDAAYKADLDGKYLAYMLANPTSAKVYEWRYAITAEFVSKYMKFSDDSLVFIDACGSARVELQAAFTKAHASAFAGWTAPTSSGDRPNYFFDRMLGINGAYEKFKKPKPPNRPFDVEAVIWTMAKEGTSTMVHAGGTTKLVVGRSAGSFGLLRPSIERLVINEEKDELEIHGLFGDSWGKVTINDTEVAVKEEWNSKKLVVELPGADEPGGAGNVVVTVRKHESNAVPLTLWHGEFTYTEGPDMLGGMWIMTYDLYLRADVHRYRTKPDTDPEDHEKVQIEAAKGSTAQWQCNWSGSVAAVGVSAGSSGKIPLDRNPLAAASFMVEGTLVPKDHAMQDLSFPTHTAPDSICPTHVTGPTLSYDTYTDFLFLSVLEAEPTAPISELKLGESWQITRKKIGLIQAGTWPWLEWPGITPKHAPDEEKTDA
jgi:hypothetical protein